MVIFHSSDWGNMGEPPNLPLSREQKSPQGPEDSSGRGSGGMSFSTPVAKAPAHSHSRGLRTVRRASGRGKGTHHLRLSWSAEHFLRGRSAALLASLGDQGGLMEMSWPKAA